jgi:hypothetical protein
MAGSNKFENMRIKKKFRRKRTTYHCCYAIDGNVNKFSNGYCCTFPQVYKRQDIKHYNNLAAIYFDEDELLSSFIS